MEILSALHSLIIPSCKTNVSEEAQKLVEQLDWTQVPLLDRRSHPLLHEIATQAVPPAHIYTAALFKIIWSAAGPELWHHKQYRDEYDNTPLMRLCSEMYMPVIFTPSTELMNWVNTNIPPVYNLCDPYLGGRRAWQPNQLSYNQYIK